MGDTVYEHQNRRITCQLGKQDNLCWYQDRPCCLNCFIYVVPEEAKGMGTLVRRNRRVEHKASCTDAHEMSRISY